MELGVGLCQMPITIVIIAFAARQQVLQCKQNVISHMRTLAGNQSARLAAPHVHIRPRFAGDGRWVGHAVMVVAATLLMDPRNYRVPLQLITCQRRSAHSVATCILCA